MKPLVRINKFHLASSMLSALVAMSAFALQIDGDAVPIYPNTHKRGSHELLDEKVVVQFINQGNTISIYSSDSPDTVDRWYTQMLPKCARTTVDGAHVYRHVCAIHTVNISPSQGETSINIGPNYTP